MQEIIISRKPECVTEYLVSKHADYRMHQRDIDKNIVELVLRHGRLIRSRRACFYVIGKRDVNQLQNKGVNTEGLENVHVVVDEKSNTVLTVYKNNNFRNIRPTHRRDRNLH